VRQSHAHAWSEVWLPGRGWWRVDPTAAVAPSASSAASRRQPLGRNSPKAACCATRSSLAGPDVVGQPERRVERLGRALRSREPGGAARALGFTNPVGRLCDRARRRPRARGRRPLCCGSHSSTAAAPGCRDGGLPEFTGRLAPRHRAGVGEAPRAFAKRVRYLRPDLGVASLSITEAYLRLRYGPAPAARI
jgi:hypothetical protein